MFRGLPSKMLGRTTTMTESRNSNTYPPTAEFAAQANVTAADYEAAAEDRLGFWADKARSLVDWKTPFTETLDWSNPPFARWFGDGQLNVAANCLDRHVEAGN